MEEERGFSNNRLAVESFLGDESQKSHHGDSSVLDLFRHHLHLSLLVFWEQVQRVEVAVSGNVVLGLLVHHFHVLEFDNSSKRDDGEPVSRSNLVETSVEERRRLSGRGEKRGKSNRIGNWLVEKFGKRPPDDGEHCKARVLDFGLTHIHELFFVFSCKTEWTEMKKRRSRKVEKNFVRL